MATPRVAHGIFDPHLEAFIKASGFLETARASRRPEKERVEGPPDSYADRNAAEDLAQSVMYFFVDPKRLKEGDGRGRGRRHVGQPVPQALRVHQEHRRGLESGVTASPRGYRR